jgi:predicted NodU family carbamoyl transferase
MYGTNGITAQNGPQVVFFSAHCYDGCGMEQHPAYFAIHAGHDGNACRLDGSILLHLELERLTRTKHFFLMPNEYPFIRCTALFDQALPVSPRRTATICHSIHADAFNLGDVTFSFDDPRPPAMNRIFPGTAMCLLDHHFAHACAAWLTRPPEMEEADILAYDGWGLYTDRVFFDRSQKMVDSTVLGLGMLWAHVSWALFRNPQQEGKAMGLAAYGTPSSAMEDGLLEHLAVMSEFNCTGDPAERIRKKSLLIPRAGDIIGKRYRTLAGDGWKRDLARTLQDLSRRLVLEYLAARRTSENLCMAGGVALNGYINQALMEEGIYRRVHVPPACGDDGLALGACLWMAWRDGARRMNRPVDIMYGGRHYPVDEALVRNLVLGTDMTIRHCPPPHLQSQTAGLLASGKIVGWYQGRSEIGPRALGNRSILADPRDPGMKDRLNARVKHREPFRPFAPAVLAERTDDWFVGVREGRYMLHICRFKDEARARVPSVVHVDGTGRIQTVRREDNDRFYDLLRAFENLTGVPILLNTSFNDNNEPIVDTPRDAFRTFASTEMDVLVLGDWIVEKAAQSPLKNPA